MSSESEYYSEEDGVVSQSASGTSSDHSSNHDESVESEVPSANVTVLDTESDDESIPRQSKAKTGGRRRAVVVSDSEEEDELDQRGLSPRTRMSITGVRPQDIDDDSSEIESDEEQEEAAAEEEKPSDANATYHEDLESNPKTGGRRRAVIVSDSEEEDELDQRGLSPRTRMSITGVRPQDIDDDSSEIESDEEQKAVVEEEKPTDANATFHEDLESHEEAATSNKTTDDPANDDDVEAHEEAVSADAPRYSTQFVSNIKEKLHSTLFPVAEQSEQQTGCESTNSSSSDVLILSNKEIPIEISSGSDEEESSNNKENQSQNSNSIGASLGSSTIVKEASVKSVNVSRDFYAKEMREIAALRLKKSEAEQLFEKVAHKLPDNGVQIKKRISGLQEEINKKTRYLEGCNVQREETPKKVQLPQKPQMSKPVDKELDWNDLSAAVNLIQPTHTGTQGLATFNAQKALTVESLKDLHGSLKDCPGEDVQAEDPSGLKVQLMGHQKHALAWMAWREQQRPRGGILADDMGLGKTLTMISLVLACKNRQESDSGNKSESSDDEDAEDNRHTGAWYSKGRKDNYQGGTLVVCPASLIRQWENEVSSKLSRHRLTVCVHHGSNRDSKAKHLRTYDMVVTTYNIVSREHKVGGALFGVKWRRVILDEAHVIRNHKSQSSVAVSELLAKFRWSLTGTPIQNKELDVYALLKFLRCSPFDDLATWKRWIDNKSAGGQERLNLLMKSIMLRRTKVQLQLNGKLNSLPNKKIVLVEMHLDKHEMNVYQRVMTYSRTLFAQFLLQRAEKDSDLNFVRDANKSTYNQIKDPNGAYYKMHEKFARMAGHSKEVKSHEILVLLLRLRQICCHPGLIDAMLEEDNGDVSNGDSIETSSEIDLLAQLNKLAISDSSATQTDDGVERPLEGEDVHIAKASQNVLKRSNPVFDFNRPSTKMLRTLELLKTILKNDDKVIVVSQWKTVLDILRDMLNKERLPSLELNGTVLVKNRQDIVNEFNNPSSPKRILLLSLTAGGVGLNLIGANHLILLDLHWNPQLEAQAQDRIYRVGQKKDVVIYKMMCMDTVEQRIKVLQDRKLELADGLLTGKVSSKLSIDDLKGLFGM
ncbi:transcription termination factor 2 [Drosophila albomicans]|uniref:Transcription termination factor 2 n=1 Tax=Drosophila albomicans TaxID=7291 RepID=A0A6P8Y1A7_DROAB|nr:transcription termination factor 2 [Drosophila albomicans]